MIYPIIVSKFNDTYSVNSPGFPEEIFVDGNDIEEVMENAEISINEYIANCLENKKIYPSSFNDNQLKEVYSSNSGSIINLVSVDMCECIKRYSRKYDNQTVTIPAVLNQYGIAHALNFSAILANGILNIIDSDTKNH